MVFSSNWLCAIAILLFAAVVQSQVQESTTKQPPTPPPFTANNQGTYNLKKSFCARSYIVVAVEYQEACEFQALYTECAHKQC